MTNDHYIKQKKIRRLTPLECWRLQGFRDKDFFSVKDVSDTQLYKQAGNSITINVLMELFKKKAEFGSNKYFMVEHLTSEKLNAISDNCTLISD